MAVRGRPIGRLRGGALLLVDTAPLIYHLENNEQYARLRLPDAIQLATALAIQARALVTHDRDFSTVEDIPII